MGFQNLRGGLTLNQRYNHGVLQQLRSLALRAPCHECKLLALRIIPLSSTPSGHFHYPQASEFT